MRMPGAVVLKAVTLILWLSVCPTCFVAAQSPPVDPNAESNCVVKTDDNLVYTFTQFNLPPLLGVFPSVGPNNQTEYFSVLVQLCSRVDLLVGNASRQPQIEWMGWNHGSTLTAFSYVGDLLQQEQFVQNYSEGDTGYSCASGRNASVSVFCHNSPDDVVCDGVGCLSPNPSGYGNVGDYCICSAAYDRLTNPCSLSVQISLKCPGPIWIPVPLAPHGSVLGAAGIAGISAVVAIFGVAVGCVGIVAYRRRQAAAANPTSLLIDGSALPPEDQSLLPMPRSESMEFRSAMEAIPDTIEDPAEPPDDTASIHPRNFYRTLESRTLESRGSFYGTLD
eukprot:TRINITY_DN11258_c0_g1_i1.p2 TRINITY_DN11258_c0_g1~~TRINITY_DN11258_c0_g1_i1.p2  ORF type:complete len:335 (-),score=34.25 TRINITY_DN11258_c0_g1_i1:228-1232(-)